ncbi:Gfo/Idh/MocA family protein [Zophobihabitans entericus]|uniref:Gfo/Idh/MocA family oxidoreductase n=1 Tax=Zophobihabitans entericus TaxID=1635327 RepID=A0A6G9ICF6_9GAMM|nr:Gfo/Idh/MocA family oxidoreductase [Zophobihabitans entericus]QIQ21915.1 Gfo/Idh/MocA family oxidoreductase [Zophobihabitans entericus]
MIRLAIIGTNWITDKFVDAAHQTGKIKLVAVYSRKIEQAKEFGKKYHVEHYFDSLEDMANSDLIDAVYIASPNSFHYPQAKFFLEHKKHVVCEKPITSNIEQTRSLIKIAKENQKIIFEAFKTPYLPNFEVVKQFLPKLGKLRKVLLTYCQYSSRYQRYLDGENPNTFNPEFSNGSIMDIGLYPAGAAIALWGKPKTVYANATLLDSGVDAHGTVVMNYGDFDVTIFHSKVSDSNIPSEIQGEDGSILIEHESVMEKVTFIPRKGLGVTENLTLEQKENTMYYEAEVFAKLVQDNQLDHKGLVYSEQLSELLTEVRRQTGVVFPADKQSI